MDSIECRRCVVEGHGGQKRVLTWIRKEQGRVGARPSQRTIYPQKGGELMEIYILEVEVLEEKLAPIGGSSGGN